MESALTIEQPDNELAWDELLEYVRAGRIVPIIGPGLLRAPLPGGEVRLESVIAQRLAVRLAKVSAQFPASLLMSDEPPVHVAGRWLAQGGTPGDVSNAISDVLKTLAGLPVPPPLLQLAEITDFNLFVTLTYDTCLERAIRAVRPENAKVTAYNYSLRRPLPSIREPGSETSVLYLFGQASRLDYFAITEEDLLEYAHSVVSQPADNRTPTVLDEVRQRNLLIIGADLPRWLSRFFLRFSKRYRLWATRGERLVDFIADHSIEEDIALTEFLKTFSNRHVLFPLDPAAFVQELHRRWMELAQQTRPKVAQPVNEGVDCESQPRIFISYASEDRQIAEALKDALAAASLRVWLDREALEAGDAFDFRIQQAVRNAAVFVPILSVAAEDSGNRWFRKEWAWAVDAMSGRRSDLRFVCPMVVGNVPRNSRWIPDSFRDVQWTETNGNDVPSRFVSQLKEAYRDYQRSRAR